MRPRQPAAASSGMPPELERFVMADWDELPARPGADFVERWECQTGTKAALDVEWGFWRQLKARQAWNRARATYAQGQP